MSKNMGFHEIQQDQQKIAKKSQSETKLAHKPVQCSKYLVIRIKISFVFEIPVSVLLDLSCLLYFYLHLLILLRTAC